MAASSDFYCNVCMKGFPKKRNLERHFEREKHRALVESLSAVEQHLGLESCQQSKEMEEEQAYACSGIDDGDDAVGDDDDDDDETFHMDDVSLQELLQCLEASGQTGSNPFPSHLFALLFFLIHSPHPLGTSNLTFFWFILKTAGLVVPSMNAVKTFKLPGYLPPAHCLSPQGFPFYYISMSSIISHCLGTPKLASSLVRYPVESPNTFREMYHGTRWSTDTRFSAPMVSVSPDISVFLRDCVTFLHPQVGLATGIVVQFFLKESSVEILAKIDVLLNVAQFKSMVPSSCIYHLPENTLIVYEQIVLPTSAIRSLQQQPLDIVKWDPFSGLCKRVSSEESAAYLSPHPLKAKAAGRKVVMLPVILFADDTSGNKSKKWHKFESWYFLLAGLPRHENAKPENIHFLCSSDRMSALDMTTPIADELIQLENNGVVVYDAYQNEDVLVIAPLLCIICDNPMASQLLNHLGGSANKYCRFCMADRVQSPHLICAERTISDSLQQMIVIRSQPTQQLRDQHRTLFGVREDPNPMLHIPGDIYRCIPLEVLHTLLLGACKYFLKHTMPTLSKRQKAEILARMTAFCFSGFRVKVHGNVCYYYKSFVGRDFKAWSQMSLFILSPYLGEGERKVLLALSKVFRIAYCDFFDPTEERKWEQICVDFVHSMKEFMPELLLKQKTHYLLHLVECMKGFGPSSAFSAERCESFNSAVRLQNIFGNKQAPSRDIANHFAVVEHLRFICNGGIYNNSEKCSQGLQDLYNSHQVQSFFNSASSKILNANKEIYKPGTARMTTSYHGGFSKLKIKSTTADGTIEELQLQNPPFTVMQHIGTTDGDVKEYRAVVSRTCDLVHSGDYVKLHPGFCQFTFGQLLATIKTQSDHTLCIVQGFEPKELPNGQQCINSFECPLFRLSRTIFTVDSSRIETPVSMVHECQNHCKFKETPTPTMVEREKISNAKLVFEHDWTQLLYCYNVYCILKNV